jgi:PDZ domain-containing secreted protein
MSGHIEDKKVNAAIRKLGGADVYELFTAEVVAINDDDTVDVEDDGTLYHSVSLRAVSNGKKGVVVVPVKNSYVLVGRVQLGNNYLVMQVSEVDKIKIDSDEIIFNGGNNAGMVMSKEVTKKINALEDKVNELISTLQKIVVSPSGLAFAPLFAPIFPLVKTDKKEIENEKIKH